MYTYNRIERMQGGHLSLPGPPGCCKDTVTVTASMQAQAPKSLTHLDCHTRALATSPPARVRLVTVPKKPIAPGQGILHCVAVGSAEASRRELEVVSELEY